MKIQIIKTHEVKYRVEYFEAQEGGMDCDSYGKTVETIEEAIVLLESAKNTTSDCDWMITCEVKTVIKQG